MLKACDLFCGAGGTTHGAHLSGKVKVVLAINHWRTAIYSHQANYPDARHICARIEHVDPADFREMGINILFASPECTWHSVARGGRPINDQLRVTPWCLPKWIDTLLPEWVVIENVPEFVNWGPVDEAGQPIKSRKGEIFQAWLNTIRAMGYHVEHRTLNAADYGGAQARVRFFAICRRGASTEPIPWPKPTHSRDTWRPAAEIIDWDIPCQSIFTRKRPLQPKTLARLEMGLRRFVRPDWVEPFLVKLRGTSTVCSIDKPMPTITAGGGHLGLAQPFLFEMTGRGAGRSSSIEDPLKTVIASRNTHGLAVPYTLTTKQTVRLATPFILNLGGRNNGEAAAIDKPLSTVVTRYHHHLVVPYLVDVNHGDEKGSPGRDRSYSVNEPLNTVTTRNGQGLVFPFLTKYHGTGGAVPVTEPLSTITTKERHGLALVRAMEELGVYDIGFRMLVVKELLLAQGLPADYALHGPIKEQVKQIGNAVHSAVAEAISTAISDHVERRKSA